MMREGDFTEGNIYSPLVKFALPVLAALFLQSLYGAVDLLVVGQFASSADVSAVSTGSMLLQTVTNAIAGLSMGATVLIGQSLGRREQEKAGRVMGASIMFFIVFGIVLSVLMLTGTRTLADIMHAPAEAYDATCDYIRICSAGLLFIIGYNLIGAFLRGLGNSKIPLLTVMIAAVINVFGDLLLVAVFHMGAAGAAYATVGSQAVSVLISFLILRKMELPFIFHKNMVKWEGKLIKDMVGLGVPIAASDFLVGISFLVILSLVNRLGVTASAGVGVGEKVCGFIMLVPSAFSQSLAAFTAQNYGAGRLDRAYKALLYSFLLSFSIGIGMSMMSWFKGYLLCGIFARDEAVIAAGWQYIRAYAIDCWITPFFFNLAGFFNGCGRTKIVMVENVAGGVFVRLPLAFIFSTMKPVSLFRIGCSTPCASSLQTLICLVYFFHIRKRLQYDEEKR
ncbi:MAG: MATE family efflux transporter [Erysipelotrichaceae bacterium]|jgi:putative MATE family efflux protein